MAVVHSEFWHLLLCENIYQKSLALSEVCNVFHNFSPFTFGTSLSVPKVTYLKTELSIKLPELKGTAKSRRLPIETSDKMSLGSIELS